MTKKRKRDLTGKHREEINIEIADEAKGWRVRNEAWWSDGGSA